MNGQKERDPGRAALPAAKQELRVFPIADGEVQRGAHTTAEVDLDLSPIRVRPKALIEFFEQRHHRVELLRQHLIADLLHGVVDLLGRLDRPLGRGQLRGLIVDLYPQLFNATFERGNAIMGARRLQDE